MNSRRIEAVTVMFCGPHDNDGMVSFRRVDHAITVANRESSPLLLAGDARRGYDLVLFRIRAIEGGVRDVQNLYHPKANTLSDAGSLARQLLTPRFQQVVEILLVTDSWHMARASCMLAGELARICQGRTFTLVSKDVTIGPTPPEHVLDGELRGKEDYLRGAYGQRAVVQPFGKPTASRA